MTERHDTPPTTWHAGPELLQEYAAGRLDPVGQAAVETHVEQCAECRRHTSSLVRTAELDPLWDRVLVAMRTPEPSWPSRLLLRLGVPEVDLVVLRASANLMLALSIAVAASVGFAIAAAELPQGRQEVAWLAIAPLIPAILVAGAYDSTEPARELAEATPYSKLRVALLRTVVAVVGALPLVLAMSLVPNISASVTTWLLPALAVTLVLLVLLTRLRAVVALTVVVSVWLVGVAALRAGEQLHAVTEPAGQTLSLLVAVAAAVALAHRLGGFRLEGKRS